MLLALAGAIAAVIRSRRKPEVTTSAAEADAHGVTPAAEVADRQRPTSTRADADVKRPVRTS
jgi:hypothetical protein